MATPVLSTNSYKLNNAMRLQQDISSNGEFFYLFTSDFSNHANTELQPIYDNTAQTYSKIYKDMIFGKRISANSVALAIVNVPWTSNTTYAKYDDISYTLATDPFYAITNEGSYYHVWKCIDNNNGSPSSIQPQIAYVSGANTVTFQTSDRYRWKYMTSVDNSTVAKFAVGSSYFPVVANAAITAAAVPGSIDMINVDEGGKGYNNYVSGALHTADIYVNGTKTWFNISNNQVVTTNNFYTGCMFLITSGPAKGQYRTVTNYVANSQGSIVQIDSQLLFDPVNGDTYEITPQATITGDGLQTVNCAARALVNAVNSNSVYRIEVLEAGANYRYATANIQVSSLVGVVIPATIRPIMPPPGGHGANTYNELYCHNLVISTTFANTEANTIPAANKFNTFGLLRNPLWANVGLTLSTYRGTFLEGETVMQITPSRLNSNATLIIGNTTISCNTAEWTTQVQPGEDIYLTTSDYAIAQLNQVNAIVNSSTITVTSAVHFACTQALIYSANVLSSAVISAVPPTPNTIFISNSSPSMGQVGTMLMGITSGAQGIIANYTVSGALKGYNTFIGLHKYIATTVNGSFVEGETINQGSLTANIFSIDGSGTLTIYASGNPLTVDGGTIVGQTSGAIANITTVYPPELVYNSADIEYIENISPVTRQPSQTETIQLVLNY
jgi:hypothetical protein